MAEIIPFPTKAEDRPDLDLVTAVDVAIRDLRDILRGWGEEPARNQADECRLMLEQAYRAAIADR